MPCPTCPRCLGRIVEASSQLGIVGWIAISSPDTDLTAGLVQLPGGLASTAQLDQRACAGPGQAPTLSLVPVGRGGLALVPDADQSQSAFVMAGRDTAPGGPASREAWPQLAHFRALPMVAPSSIACTH